MGRFLEIAKPHADDPMSMDVGHALMIGQFIREIDATSVVEVGCCYGISTGAILDAFEERREGVCELRRQRLLHLIDVKFQQPIMDMHFARQWQDTLVRIDERPSLSKYGDGKLPTLGRFYGEVVILDGNHPLAGMSLRFDLEVDDLREASDEEVAAEIERQKPD